MKKKIIALLLSVVLAAGSIGATPVFAAETTAEEAVAVEEEVSEIINDADTGLTVGDVSEEETIQAEDEESVEEEWEVEESTEEQSESADIVVPEVTAGVEEMEDHADEESSAKVISSEEADTVKEETESVEETLTFTCGGESSFIEYDHDQGVSVSFEVDSDLCVEYREEDCVVDYTTNTARCLFFGLGASKGTIKAINSDTGELLKTFKIEILPGTEEVSVGKGKYIWTYLPETLGRPMNRTECDGVSIQLRSVHEEWGGWGYMGSDLGDDNQLLINYSYAVIGEKTGDYTVAYYSESTDSPFYVVTYHVTDDGEGEDPQDLPAPAIEDSVRINCGGDLSFIEYEHNQEINVSLEVDPDLCMEYQLEDCPVDYSTSVARCMFLGLGASRGTIKAINSDTGELLKTFKIEILPGTEEVSVGIGKYIWTHLPVTLDRPMNRTECNGVSIQLRSVHEEWGGWGHMGSDLGDHNPLFRDYTYAVRGEKTGDYTVTYYSESVDSPFYIVTYHVTDDGDGEDPEDAPDQGTEETVTITCSGEPAFIEYDHDLNLNVSFKIDSNFCFEYRTEDCVCDYTNNVARCLFFPEGAAEGTIKAVDSDSGTVLKTFNIQIVPGSEEMTVCKGEYFWTYPPAVLNTSLNRTECDGISIQLRDMHQEWGGWGYMGSDLGADNTLLTNCSYAVKGEKAGDYTVAYYTESENRPYYIVTYHVVDHDYQNTYYIKETCTEEGILKRECSICHEKTVETIPATGHTWAKDYTVDKEPTQTEAGSESIHCTVCDAINESSIRVIPKLGFSVDAKFELEKPAFNYTGRPITPGVTVTYNGKQLVRDKDYKVTYKNNIDLGQADVDVSGIGKYSGTEHLHFTIRIGAPKKVTCTNVASGMKVSWEKVNGATRYKVYRDGKYIFTTSALEVTDKDVKYKGGTKYVYKVVATEKRFGDSKMYKTSTCYRLMPVGIKSLTNPSAGKMTVTYDKSAGCYGYVVRFGLKKDMSDARVITVQGQNTTSRTFGGMKKGKTYYVQVRTYKLDNGVRYYSGYCTTKTITIKK